MPEEFLRDLRLGFRVLIKEKSFCALAVIVLALGICGVTTMFSVVNGVMLRGFSFPNAARLASVELRRSVQRQLLRRQRPGLRDGLRGVAARAEVVRAAGGVPERLDRQRRPSTAQPQRYTGAYITENFLRILGVVADDGPRLHRRRTTSRAPRRSRIIGYGIWQRDFGGAADIVGKDVRINGKPATIIGVMPKGFAFPTNEELWIPLYSEFPPRPRNDPRERQPGRARPAQARRLARSGERRVHRRSPSRFAAAYPDTNKQFNTGQVQPLIETFTPRPLRGTLLTMLGFCVGVLLIACVNVMNMQFARATLRAQGAGGPLVARRDAHAADPADAHREPARRRHRRGARHRRSRTRRSTGSRRRSATSTTRRPSWITFDVDALVLAFTVAAMLVAAVASGTAAGLDVVARQRRRRAARRRPRQHEPQHQPHVARPGRVPDRRHLRAADRIAAAGPVDPQPADDRLRLRHRAACCRRAWV